MKKRIIAEIILCFAIIVSVVCASCTGVKKPDSSVKNIDAEQCDEIVIETVTTDITLIEDDVEGFDYTSYFVIYGDGKKVKTKSEYIDSSDVLIRVGTYKVVCRVKDVSAEITVHVNSSGKVTEVKIEALKTRVDIKDDEINTYDFAALFKITEDGKTRTTLPSDIDLSSIRPQRGSYLVYCKYKGKEASIKVYVTEAVYSVSVSGESVTLNVLQIDSYDFAKLFTVTRDGEAYTVKASDLQTDVLPEAGEYTVTLKVGKIEKSVKVIVIEGDVAIIGRAYSSVNMPLKDALTHDFAKDFYLYVNGNVMPVDEACVDVSELENAAVGDSVKVYYRHGGYSAYITVRLTEDDVVITAKDIELFSNSAAVDVTSLFEVTRSGKTVEVTADMISGVIDYSKPGENLITINYEGRTATAKVTIKTGLIVSYANGSVVYVKKGTDKSTYDFSGDFTVTVNGVAFSDISQFINEDDINAVDFSVEGTYEVRISLPYNDKTVGISGVKFDYYEKTITYRVVLSEYSYEFKSEVLTVKKGTDSFNPYSNINLVINGVKQIITENKNQVNVQVCYAETVIIPDFDVIGEQTVRVALYVNGPDQAPVYVDYAVLVVSDTEVTATDAAIFAGNNLYLPDLFEVKADGNMVAVTTDMITGRFDAFTPGIYTLTLTYNGVSASAEVTVLDRKFVGVYSTPCRTVAKDAEVDGDGDVISDAVESKKIADLVISEDLNISRGNKVATNIKSLDSRTFSFRFGEQVYNTYTLYYSDGVAALVYDNSLRLSLSDDTRPVLYFNNDYRTVKSSFVFNSSKSGYHVLQLDKVSGSTIELFKTEDKHGNTEWFGLRIAVNYAANSYNYETSFGKAELSDGFNAEEGQSGTITIDGRAYSVKTSANGKGSIADSGSVNPYLNKVFRGTVNGSSASFTVASNGDIKFAVGTNTEFAISSSELSSMKYKPYDLQNSTFTVYGLKTALTYSGYEYKCKFEQALQSEYSDNAQPFAYKFVLDVSNGTFTLAEKDKFFGLYKNGDNYFFFDGYGGGVAHYSGQDAHTETQISYLTYGNEAVVSHENVLSDFAYGKGARLTLNADGNTYTVMSSDKAVKAGDVYENFAITDGYIVKINKFIYKQGSKKADLLEQITVRGKGGYLSDSEKEAMVNTKTVGFNKPGFYQFVVNETQYYALMVVGKRFEGNFFVRSFGNSFDGNASLSIDEYGYVTFAFGGENYTGYVNISDNGFFGTCENADKSKIKLTGKNYADGIISVTASGAISASEMFASYGSVYSANDVYTLRSVNTASGTEYYLSGSIYSLGEKVELRFVSGSTFAAGSIVEVLKTNGETVKFRIDAISSQSGLIEIDELAGEYLGSNGAKLVLDGFGSATLNGVKGSYVGVISDGVRYVLFKNALNTEYKKLTIALSEKTFVDLGDVLSERVLSGKTFTYQAYITMEEGDYALISVTFGSNGAVKITAKNGENCNVEEPDYTGNGTYEISLDTVTVTVKSFVFVFKANDPVNFSTILLVTSPATGEEVRISGNTEFDRA